MGVIGARAKPRVLVIDGGDLPAGVLEEVRELVPTVEQVSPDDVVAVDLAEWDAVVTDRWQHRDGGAGLELGAHLHVLAFLDGGIDGEVVDHWHVGSKPYLSGSLPVDAWVRCERPDRGGDELRPLPAEDPAHMGVNRLIEDTLIPAVEARASYWTFKMRGVPGIALGEDASGRPLACLYRRGRVVDDAGTAEGAVAIVLPADVEKPELWVRWAFRLWKRTDPAAFGGIRDWDRDAGWLTRAQRDVRDAISALERERAAALDEFEQRLAGLDQRASELANQAAATDAAATEGERRLLTGAGDELIDAVAAALRRLGFDVEPVGERADHPDEAMEDLRVRDPDEPAWIALVEVRGYDQGAESNDLNRIVRFDKRYFKDTGEDASALWYVVNHFRHHDPAQREIPLQWKPAEVGDFVADRGSVIDTRRMFRLVTEPALPDRAQLDPLRAAMRAHTGRWPLDPADWLPVSSAEDA